MAIDIYQLNEMIGKYREGRMDEIPGESLNDIVCMNSEKLASMLKHLKGFSEYGILYIRRCWHFADVRKWIDKYGAVAVLLGISDAYRGYSPMKSFDENPGLKEVEERIKHYCKRKEAEINQ